MFLVGLLLLYVIYQLWKYCQIYHGRAKRGRGIWLIFHEVHPIFHEDHPIFHEAQPSGIWDGPSGIWGGPSGIWEKSHEATSTRQNSSTSGSTSYSTRRSRVEYEVLTRVDEFCRVDGAEFDFVHISCRAEYGKWYIGIIPRWKMCYHK